MHWKKTIAWSMKIGACVIALSALGFTAFAIWAKGKSESQLLHNAVLRMMVRPVRFRNSLRSRHEHCSIAEAWSLSSFDNFQAEEDIRRSFKTIRTDGPYSLVRTPLGEIWMPSRDVYAAAEMILDQRQDIYQPGAKGVRAGDIVLDCGANVGIYTKYALSKGARRVIAIEVAPEDIECLRRTLASEVAASSVTIYPRGVWDKETALQLQSDPALSSMANSVALGTHSAGPVVALTTIDKIVTELALPSVDFIKMDIEGAEANALRGASQTLTRFRPRLAIALEHRRSDPDTIPALVKSQWPFYKADLGACAERGGEGHIQPNVLFAHAD